MLQAKKPARSAWLNDVPADWDEIRFRHVATIEGRLVDPTEDPWSGLPMLAPNHVEKETGKVSGLQTASEQGADSAKYPVRAGQVVYSKIRPALNKVAIAPEAGTCSADMYPVDFDDRVYSRFAWYFMRARPFHAYATVTSMRVKMPKINREDLSDAPFLVPPLDQQRAIADYLDRETAQIDTLIEEQQRLLKQLRDRRIAVIFEAVTRGLDPGATSRQTGVDWCPEVPSHWATQRLKYSIQSSTTGVWGAEPRGSDDDILCVRVADFDRPRLRVRDEIPTVRAVPEKDRAGRLLAPGDLLIEKSGGTAINPVGFVGIFEGASRPAISANFLARLRLREGQDERFWLYAHAAAYSSRLTARSVRQTTGIQNLDLQSYLNEYFPFPPSAEQKQIAKHLDLKTARIDHLLEEARKVIELARERRSALITAAVTGQIDAGTAA